MAHPQIQPMPEGTNTDIREVQTASLRREKSEENTIIVSITPAIRAAGLEDGGSFRFMPGSVGEIGMLAAIGAGESTNPHTDRFTRNIRHEGHEGQTLRLVIPHGALSQLIDPETIDWEDPPEMNVWAGDRMLAFELAEREERTVEIDRENTNDDGESGEDT